VGLLKLMISKPRRGYYFVNGLRFTIQVIEEDAHRVLIEAEDGTTAWVDRKVIALKEVQPSTS